MKLHVKSFGMKLWLYFILFSMLILGSLWLLQTVFLQSFYHGMIIRNVKHVAGQIVLQQDSPGLENLIDDLTYQNALLIFLTDPQGNILYSSDEHSSLYDRQDWHKKEENPYRQGGEPLSWQIGALHNLPQDYADFLQKLSESVDGQLGYRLKDNSAYVYGLRLLPEGTEAVLYISAQLEPVGATVGILRVQLAWVTAASLVLSLVMAFFLARRFSRPVASISAKARRMADGAYQASFDKGFCTELDGLADTLNQTAAQLARAEDARRELLANVSHDLRTPLTIIKGYAEMVREISWENQEDREADLAVIIREADRLTVLVRDILEYSSLQNNQQPAHFETVDLSALMQGALEQFGHLFRQEGYSIETAISPGQMVEGSREQLMRVLYNLIDNALVHCGGSRKIQAALKSVNTVVRVEIRDYGAGIPQEELPYVWERYFTSKQRKRDGRVSGLGLAIVKEILTAHKAAFGVESTAGQGSVFWFELERANPR